MAKGFSVFVEIGGRIGPSFTGAIKTAEDKLSGLSRHMRAQAAAQRAAMRGIADSMKGVAALAAGGGISLGIKSAIGSGVEIAHEMQALKNAGRTVGELAEAMEAANKTMLKLPTTRLQDNLAVLNETTGAFGDWHHALENLEFNQKIGSVLKNAIGEKAGHGHEMFNQLVRGFEIRGTAADHEVYQREAGELARAMIFTRGNVNPAEFLNFAQQANPAIKNYSERFLTKIAPSLIQEFGGDRAGTRAGAWYNAIMGKTRDKRMADAWVKLGLLDRKNVLTNKKTGDIIGWNPGAMKNTDLAMSDPLEWTEKTLIPALQKAGINVDDQKAVTKELGKLFRNSEANRFANAITHTRDRKRLHKDEGLINQVPDADTAYYDTLINDPKMAFDAFKNSFSNLGGALTLPLMKPAAKALVEIARAVNFLASVLVKNPAIAKALGGLATALAAMAAVKIASFIFGITGLGRALALLLLAVPMGLAARLLTVARAIMTLTVATALGAVARLRTLATALALLAVPGGARLALAALGTSLLAFGRAVLMFPIVALRAIPAALMLLVSNPIGLAVAAVVTALAALGLWISNNASGIATFFTSFADSFIKALGPGAASAVTSIVSALQSVWDWVSKILGPIDEAGTKWKAWGEAAGQGAAGVVNALSGLPAQISALGSQLAEAGRAAMQSLWDGMKAVAEGIIGWATGIAGRIAAPFVGIGSRIRSALGGAAPAQSAPAAPTAPAAPATPRLGGERALGGPVRSGVPYLVGERGPEIFMPNGSGRIETNRTLNGPASVGSGQRESNRTPNSIASIGSEQNERVRTPIHSAPLEDGRPAAPQIPNPLASIGSEQNETRRTPIRLASIDGGRPVTPQTPNPLASIGSGQRERDRTPIRLASINEDRPAAQAVPGLASIGTPSIGSGQRERDRTPIRLASIGSSSGAPPVRTVSATQVASVAAGNREGGSVTHVKRGDLSVQLHIQAGGGDANEIGIAAERAVRRVLAQYESQQRGMLSD